LITGIPGTGKTTVGKYFEEQWGYQHLNIEDFERKGVVFSSRGQIDALLDGSKDAVVTWGFWPRSPEIETVQACKKDGFKLMWFDGDREAALKAFNRRGDVPELRFHKQIKRIEISRVVSRIDPIIFNSFDEKGNFKTYQQIANEILNLSYHRPKT